MNKKISLQGVYLVLEIIHLLLESNIITPLEVVQLSVSGEVGGGYCSILDWSKLKKQNFGMSLNCSIFKIMSSDFQRFFVLF